MVTVLTYGLAPRRRALAGQTLAALLAATFLWAGMTRDARSQPSPASPPAETAPANDDSAAKMSPAEMAKAIAETIDAGAIKSTDGPVVFQSATAHDNVVEIQYAAKDAGFFARNKANLDSAKLALSRYYCNGSRVAFLNGGVVVHQVMLGPDGHERIEITIDRSSCTGLPVPKLADAATLARMAQTIADRENAEKAASTTGPFQFDAASASGGVVELHSVVTDTTVGRNIQAEPKQLVGLLGGYFCAKYGDDLGQGLSIHERFTFGDGSPVIDFSINRSSCGP